MTLYDRLVKWIGPLIRFFYPIRLYRLPETLPEEGILIAPNHISFFDPLFLAISLPRHITFMGKEELVHRPIIGKLVLGCGMIPLSRDGGDAAKLRQAVRALKEGKMMAVFPQGHRCRRPLDYADFKGGVGMMATLSGAAVLPVAVWAPGYRVRLFRKTHLLFGEPMHLDPPADLGKKEQSLWISQRLFEEIVRLETELRELAGVPRK